MARTELDDNPSSTERNVETEIIGVQQVKLLI